MAADKIVRAHYFLGACDWRIVEYNPAECIAFGYARLGDPQGAEWGYVSLIELEQLVIRRPFPAIVERNLHWRAKPASDCHLPGRWQ